MTKWMCYVILFSAALILGGSTQAAAQSKDQQDNSQQQASQQQDQQKQQKQSASQAGGDNQATETNSKDSAKAQKTQVPPELFVKKQESSQVLASSIIGMSIQNGTGKKAAEIGAVDDLIMNKQHQLVGIVVGIGGFLGIGRKQVGITWKAVENIDMKKGIAVVTVSKKQLQNAPAFVSKQEQQQNKKQKQLQKKARQQQQQMMQPQKQPAQGGNTASGG